MRRQSRGGEAGLHFSLGELQKLETHVQHVPQPGQAAEGCSEGEGEGWLGFVLSATGEDLHRK